LCGPSGRREGRPHGRGKHPVLGKVPGGGHGQCARCGCGLAGARSRPSGRVAGRLPLGRAEAAPVAGASRRRETADLAPGRADLGAGRRRPGPAQPPHGRSSGRRRHHSGRDPRPHRAIRSARVAAGGGGRSCPGGGNGRMTALAVMLGRDVRLAVRLGGGAPVGVLFFLIVVTLMPFALGPDQALLRRIGPAILWLGALLASLLALDRLFAADHEDGSLDLILMSRLPLEVTVAVKALAHWLTTRLPLVIAVPVLALFLDLEPRAMAAVALTLLVGTPALTCIGAMAAALA